MLIRSKNERVREARIWSTKQVSTGSEILPKTSNATTRGFEWLGTTFSTERSLSRALSRFLSTPG